MHPPEPGAAFYPVLGHEEQNSAPHIDVPALRMGLHLLKQAKKKWAKKNTFNLQRVESRKGSSLEAVSLVGPCKWNPKDQAVLQDLQAPQHSKTLERTL